MTVAAVRKLTPRQRTNVPKKGLFQKERIVFQPRVFSGDMLAFEGVHYLEGPNVRIAASHITQKQQKALLPGRLLRKQSILLNLAFPVFWKDTFFQLHCFAEASHCKLAHWDV